MCSKEPTISIGSPGHHQAPEPQSLTPRKREHRGARAPSMPGILAQPPNTTGATIFISQLQGAHVHPRKPPSIRNTATSHERLPWIRHAALPRTSSMPYNNYGNKTPHTQDATPLHCNSSPQFFRKRRAKLRGWTSPLHRRPPRPPPRTQSEKHPEGTLEARGATPQIQYPK
jgi:hypothetical protein